MTAFPSCKPFAMPGDKISILSTRLIDEAATAKTADAGIDIDSFSFIEVQSVYSGEVMSKLQSLAAQMIFVVFTSANAVTAVAEQINGNTNWKIFCTGGKTKEWVTQIFGEDSIIGYAKNASLLAERIITSAHVAKVTFFCGDQRLNDLPEKLGSGGIQTDEVIVYTTVRTPCLTDKNYDGILFFSPSAVHSFFSMNTLPVDVVLFSIGQTTTTVIQSYCTNRIITSDWPGTESLLECVTNFYNTASQEVDQNIS